MNISGAVVLIADGATAVGAAAAAAFGAAGARVAVGCDRRDDVARAAHADFWIVDGDGGPAERSAEMVRRTVEHFGTVDVLINGLARGRAIASDQLRAEDVRAAAEANLIGPIAASREALRAMRRQGRGHIINLTAPAYTLGAPLHAAQAASVAALSSWTRALQAELEETEIRVTEYFVGAITGDVDAVGDGFATAGGVRQGRLARLLATVESPEDIANQLVACVRRPRATAYSSAAVRAAAAVGLFTRLRVRLGAGAARAWRSRHGAPVFTPSALPVERTADPVVAAPATSAPAEPASVEVAPVPDAQPPASIEVAPVVNRAEPPVESVTPEPQTEAVMRAPTPEPETPRAPRKAAAKKAAAKKASSPRAPKRAAKPVAEKSTAAPRKPPRGKKVAPLSPVATARVRAAAERAAASARGKAKSARRPGDDEES